MPFADGHPGFVGADVGGVEVAHDGDVVRVVHAVAHERQDDAFGVAAQAQGFRVHLGHPERRAPADDFAVRGVLAGINEKERVRVDQPMLLGGGHRERLAVVPRPRLLGGPFQSVVAGTDVAAIVLGADGQIEATLKLGDGGFEQAAAAWVLDFFADLLDRERLAVERANHAGDGASLALCGPVGEGEEDVAVREHDALAAVVGVDVIAARVGPFELAARPPLAIAPHGIDGPAGRLIGGEFRAGVEDVVADGEHGLGLRVPVRHDVADAFLGSAGQLHAAQCRNWLRVGPSLALIR